MPQMAPMNWLTLFIEFSFVFMIINTMNFFSFNYTIQSKVNNKYLTKINWKW
uniref:ATP synthase complex subunit 8 n=1 Tax=Histeroidea sp. 1 KM-2017 TaxID=2219434 RepID=A0A346RGT5_9COLE|nr:ATP synthase F0 subunit 8 [Histeroidea sp. 1 KM-2017]